MRKEFTVGVFVILASVLFIVGMNYMKGTKLFGSSLVVYATYPNIEGIVKGNPVIINGLRSGRVANLVLVPGGVRATIEIDENIDLPKDSEAQIFASDLLGSKAIKILMGKSAENLASESTVKSSIDGGMMGKAQDLLDKQGAQILSRIDSITVELNGLLASANTTMTSVNDQKRIEAILGNLQAISGKIAGMTGSLSQVTQNAASITGNFEKKNGEISAIVSNAKRTTDSVASATAQLGPVISSARESVAKLQQTIAVLQTDQSSIGKLLYSRDMYTRIDSITGNVNSLLDDMKAHPRRYFDVDVYLIERKKAAEKE